jgi:hypothetical protein
VPRRRGQRLRRERPHISGQFSSPPAAALIQSLMVVQRDGGSSLARRPKTFGPRGSDMSNECGFVGGEITTRTPAERRLDPGFRRTNTSGEFGVGATRLCYFLPFPGAGRRSVTSYDALLLELEVIEIVLGARETKCIQTAGKLNPH